MESRFYKDDKRKYAVLTFRVQMYTQRTDLFCGNPHMYLVCHFDFKKSNKKYCSASLGIGDMDDFDFYKTYEFSPHECRDKVHELVNFLKDHENCMLNDYELVSYPVV